jgi:hypothetical protein
MLISFVNAITEITNIATTHILPKKWDRTTHTLVTSFSHSAKSNNIEKPCRKMRLTKFFSFGEAYIGYMKYKNIIIIGDIFIINFTNYLLFYWLTAESTAGSPVLRLDTM